MLEDYWIGSRSARVAFVVSRDHLASLFLVRMALAAVVKHLAAPGGLRIHALHGFYQMPLHVREGDWERISSELPELKSDIESLGLRGQKALRLLLRTEVRMWHSLAACSSEMHNLMRPLLSRTGYPNACSWSGDVCNLTVFVSDIAHQTEFAHGEDFDRRLMIPL